MKDMLANLPQYQEQREKVHISSSPSRGLIDLEQFSLHLNMAQECMDLFEKQKLPLVGNVEQVISIKPAPLILTIKLPRIALLV
jgi:syntaxin-binding protein 1